MAAVQQIWQCPTSSTVIWISACKIMCSCEMQPGFATFSNKLLYKAPCKHRVVDYFEHFEVLIRKSHHQGRDQQSYWGNILPQWNKTHLLYSSHVFGYQYIPYSSIPVEMNSLRETLIAKGKQQLPALPDKWRLRGGMWGLETWCFDLEMPQP